MLCLVWTYLDLGEGFGEGCVDWFGGVHLLWGRGLLVYRGFSLVVVEVLLLRLSELGVNAGEIFDMFV